MNNHKYQLCTFFIGIFLTGITYNVLGQTISDTPSGNNFPLDSKTLYEHGYNSSGVDSPREDIDTVMVGSVMNYFVMPDKNYNTAYFGQGSYAATNLTSSEFEWIVGNSSSFTPQSANTTGTSPWIKVTWGSTTGATTIKVKEAPQDVDISCVAEDTEIDVFVIAQPTIGYNLAGYAASQCYNTTAVADADYDFPVSVITSSSQVLVNVSVVKKDLDGTVLGTYPKTNVPVASGAFHLEFNDFASGGYGIYEVTITEMTDRIARKCDVSGIINLGENVFTFSVMPMPKTGPVYHIPNDFE